jgi:hypothetical protein
MKGIESEKGIFMSDVAQLRQQIETELQGFQRGFSAFATTTQHAIIHNKYHMLGTYQEQLEQEIGKDAATVFICEAYMRIVG